MRLLTTGELARELGVSRSAVLKWANANPPLITPEFTTPGNHHRWNLEAVREQLRRTEGRSEGP